MSSACVSLTAANVREVSDTSAGGDRRARPADVDLADDLLSDNGGTTSTVRGFGFRTRPSFRSFWLAREKSASERSIVVFQPGPQDR